MNKLKWISLSAAALLLGGGTATWLTAKSWAQKNLSKEAIVAQLEREWNCRVGLKSIEADLLASPARITIENLALMPRDAEVSKPLAERAPIVAGVLILIRQATLVLDTSALLHKQLHVREFLVDGIDAREEISSEGESLLGTMFSKPKQDFFTKELSKIKAAQNTPVIAASDGTAVSAPDSPSAPKAVPSESPKAKEAKTKSFSLPLGLQVDAFTLSNAKFHFMNRRAKTRTDITNLSLRITEADIATDDLAHHNQCKAVISANVVSANRIKIDGTIQEVKMAEFDLSSQGTIHPFDAATGALDPDITLAMTLKKGSIFGGALNFGQAFGKDKNVSNLKDKFGLDITDLTIGGPLQEDLSTDVRVHEGRTEFLKDATLAFPQYKVALRSGSWINGPEDNHEAHLSLIPGDDLEQRLVSAIEAKVGTGFSGIIMGIVKDDKGSMVLDFQSSERLSKPKFQLDGKLKAIQDLGSKLGGGLLKGLAGTVR